MSLQQARVIYTAEEYIELERESEIRHEFLDGRIYEMAVESLAHSQICVNLAREVSTRLKVRDCQAVSLRMKVRTSTSGLFSDPDLTVVCGPPVFHDERRDVLVNPRVIFEVLSPSTEAYDRGGKFMRYRTQLATLTDYVLISQDSPLAELFTRQSDERWLYTPVLGQGSSLYIASIDCRLRLSEIYDRVEFPEPEEAEPPAEHH